MKKKLIILSLFLLNTKVYALPISLPDPKPGLVILNDAIPMSTLAKVDDDSYSSDTLGNKSYPKFLLNMDKKHISFGMTKANTEDDLKKDLSEIKLADEKLFRPLPPSIYKIIGYSPQGQYINGWTGIIAYFKTNELEDSICTYSRGRLYGANVQQSTISRAINNKVTLQYKQGDVNNGYLYTLIWYYEDRKGLIKQSIDCAAYNKDKTIIPKMIEIAKDLDKQSA